MNKKELRKKMLEKRRLYGIENIKAASRVIHERLFNHNLYLESSAVFTYINTDYEINTTDLISRALSDGKLVAVPVITGRHEMKFVQINGFECLKKNKYDILEPPLDMGKVIVPNKTSLLITPGLMFDFKGGRIGYGGGYYDKYISENIFYASIGFCMEFQLSQNELPHEQYDKQVDLLITDGRIIEPI